MKVTEQEIVEALRDCLGRIEYIKHSNGRLYGVDRERLKGYESLLSRIEKHGIAPPDGWVLVPRKLTTEMLLARNGDSWPSMLSDEAEAVWDAFISAAPEVKP